MDFVAQFSTRSAGAARLRPRRDHRLWICGGRPSPAGGFFPGVGGSAGNASHAVNDFRKIVGWKATRPTDNVCPSGRRINELGWAHRLCEWARKPPGRARRRLVLLRRRRRCPSATSGQPRAGHRHAQGRGARVGGIVGRDGGFTAKMADACVIVPTVDPETVTPHSEAFQAVIWHLLVSHPRLRVATAKWESLG